MLPLVELRRCLRGREVGGGDLWWWGVEGVSGCGVGEDTPGEASPLGVFWREKDGVDCRVCAGEFCALS